MWLIYNMMTLENCKEMSVDECNRVFDNWTGVIADLMSHTDFYGIVLLAVICFSENCAIAFLVDIQRGKTVD